MICPYCHQTAQLVSGAEIYPHRRDLWHRAFYSCPPCHAYVGCHEGTTKPLGRLANAELRLAKQQAHAAFDPLWKSGNVKRTEAYKLLAEALGLRKKGCHIGWFDVDMCRRVVEVVPAIKKGLVN